MTNPQPTLDKLPELNLILQAKTYRSKEITAENTVVEEGAPAVTDDSAGGN